MRDKIWVSYPIPALAVDSAAHFDVLFPILVDPIHVKGRSSLLHIPWESFIWLNKYPQQCADSLEPPAPRFSFKSAHLPSPFVNITDSP